MFIAVGEFIFKSVTRQDGGEFQNEKGQVIKYDPFYVLKVDEINSEGEINERKLKISATNRYLVDRLSKLKLYEKIFLRCEIRLYNNSAKVVPVSLDETENNK